MLPKTDLPYRDAVDWLKSQGYKKDGMAAWYSAIERWYNAGTKKNLFLAPSAKSGYWSIS